MRTANSVKRMEWCSDDAKDLILAKRTRSFYLRIFFIHFEAQWSRNIDESFALFCTLCEHPDSHANTPKIRDRSNGARLCVFEIKMNERKEECICMYWQIGSKLPIHTGHCVVAILSIKKESKNIYI